MRWLMVPILSGKPWNGSTIHTDSLGGSESATAYVARALAKKGEEVYVVTHGPPGVFEGVEYINNISLPQVTQQEWDVVISVRWVEVLNNVDWKAKARFFWSHDLPPGGMIELQCDKAVFLTKYHHSTWGLDEEVSRFIGDGVELGLFQNGRSEDRDKNKLLWVSNPNRGLPLAASIFQEIRKRWPDMELHVYGRASIYGWGAHEEIPYMPRREHMENVFLHESLPRYALGAELRKAWAVFYPTYWPETYCMATLEAQAAGCPVVCPPFGALTETVKGGIVTHDFLNAISQLRNERRWDKLSKAGIEWAEQNTWDIRAQEWIDLAKEVIQSASS